MSSDISLGQLGSGFVDNTGAFLPPSGKVIIAITFMSDLKFSALTAEIPTDSTFKGPQTTAGVAETNTFGTVTQTAANGTQAGTTGYSVAAAKPFHLPYIVNPFGKTLAAATE